MGRDARHGRTHLRVGRRSTSRRRPAPERTRISGSLCMTKRYAGTYIYSTGTQDRVRRARQPRVALGQDPLGQVQQQPPRPGHRPAGGAGRAGRRCGDALGGDLGAGVAGADHHEGGASGAFARTKPRTTRLTENTWPRGRTSFCATQVAVRVQSHPKDTQPGQAGAAGRPALPSFGGWLSQSWADHDPGRGPGGSGVADVCHPIAPTGAARRGLPAQLELSLVGPG
jgi:hypothetical protein